MKSLRLATAFKKDLKRIGRRKYDRELLEVVVDALRREAGLPEARRDHSLKGEWKGWRDCHVEPDWVLIYRKEGGKLELGRTGTHADLFE